MTLFKRIVHPITRKYYIEWPWLVGAAFVMFLAVSVFFS